MERPKTFQIILIAVFVVMLLLGFLGFSGKIKLPSKGGEVNYGTVTMWGTLPSTVMQTLTDQTLRGEKGVAVTYVEKNASTFDRDFIEALANGNGPDIILIHQDEILKKLNKLTLIPYQSITERDFKNTFVEEGELFLLPAGIVALPFTIDPLVMYWNRDIFTNAFIPNPPSQWSEFYDIVPKTTIRDNKGNITRSTIAFGEYRNVTNAKEVISTLVMQGGSPIVSSQNGSLSSALLTRSETNVENPVISGIRFFTEFSKQNKDAYSWNRSLPSSRLSFEAGDLAVYFGYASEFKSIKQKNPHLNFDVAMMPQVLNALKKVTFGRMQGLAIVRASKNPNGAFYAVSRLSRGDVIEGLNKITGLPPVRKDLFAKRTADAEQAVFYNSALISRAWYDPSPSETNALFMNMIDDITSARMGMTEALGVLQSSLANLLQMNSQIVK